MTTANTIKTSLTPNAMGLVLTGTKDAFQELYDAIEHIMPRNENDEFIERDDITYLLSISYDIRHQVLQSDDLKPQKKHRIKINMVNMLIYYKILRDLLESLTFDQVKSDKTLQWLNNFVRNCLNPIKRQSGLVYDEVVSSLAVTPPLSHFYDFAVANVAMANYLGYPIDVMRLSSLPSVIHLLNINSPEYFCITEKLNSLSATDYYVVLDKYTAYLDLLNQPEFSW